MEFKKTIPVSRNYPFAYGFPIGSTSGDGDNLDCFTITDQKLRSGQIVGCEPIGIMEQIEDEMEDYNVLAKLSSENVTIDKKIKCKLTEFISHVFDHKEDKEVKAGKFFGKEKAEKYIAKCLDQLNK
jgi:inorganic pyrophosphatase